MIGIKRKESKSGVYMRTQTIMQLGGFFSTEERFKERYEIREFAPIIRTISDTRYIIRSPSHKLPQDISEADKAGTDMVMHFNENAQEVLDYFKTHNIKPLLDPLREAIQSGKGAEEIQKMHKYSEIEKAILLQGLNPELYFIVIKHLALSKAYLSILAQKITIEALDKVEKIDFGKLPKADVEEFMLGLFLGAAHVFSMASLSPVNRDNPKFIAEYKKLMDKYAHLIAIEYPEVYIKAMDLDNKDTYSKNAYNTISIALGA